MNILPAKSSATRAAAAGVLPIDVRNTLSLKKFIKTTKSVYYIEAAVMSGQSIEVDYTLNDDWLHANVQLPTLKAFMTENGLNDYCFDSSDYAGSHVQEIGTFAADTYLAENLSCVVRAYFEAKRIGQYHVN